MAQAREPLAGAGAVGIGRGGMGIRRLPASLHGRHAELHVRDDRERRWGIVVFLFVWTVMMVAMMVPATLPLILLYRTIARNRLRQGWAQTGMVALLVGYIVVWTAAGLPVYAYSTLSGVAGSLAVVLPALLLIVGGVYQF